MVLLFSSTQFAGFVVNSGLHLFYYYCVIFPVIMQRGHSQRYICPYEDPMDRMGYPPWPGVGNPWEI